LIGSRRTSQRIIPKRKRNVRVLLESPVQIYYRLGHAGRSVTANAPGAEIPISEAVSLTVFVRPTRRRICVDHITAILNEH
jgi:hypothetical protein